MSGYAGPLSAQEFPGSCPSCLLNNGRIGEMSLRAPLALFAWVASSELHLAVVAKRASQKAQSGSREIVVISDTEDRDERVSEATQNVLKRTLDAPPAKGRFEPGPHCLAVRAVEISGSDSETG